MYHLRSALSLQLFLNKKESLFLYVFVCGLFNDAAGNSSYTVSYDRKIGNGVSPQTQRFGVQWLRRGTGTKCIEYYFFLDIPLFCKVVIIINRVESNS